MSTKFNEMSARLRELRQKLKLESQKVFKEGAQELFAQNPNLESFAWTQYTPYFNDGEACYFSAHTNYPDINGEDGWALRNDPQLSTLYDSVKEFLNVFSGDDLKELFGDHARITVTPNGVEIEEYEHE